MGMAESFREWESNQKILVILAHPDDPEFFMGATIAHWTQQGHKVVYYLLTKGDKGTQDRNLTPEDLMTIRVEEQKAAAKILGVDEVHFLDNPDGFLMLTTDLRREVTRIIRQEKPDILVTSDPSNFFPNDASINHPDHRMAGQIVVESYFPAAGNPKFFPELLDEGYEPHSVKEVWFSLTYVPNVIFDITKTWPVKMKALHEHRSQIGDPQQFDVRMRSRHTPDSTEEAPRFEEKFRRITYPRWTMIDFYTEAQNLFEFTQMLRRDFHRHPELGFQEVRTAGIVARELTQLGLEVTTGIAKTGVAAILEGGKPGTGGLTAVWYGCPARCWRKRGRI